MAPDLYRELQARLPLWHGDKDCVRAAFCSGTAEQAGGCCSACGAVGRDRAVRDLARATGGRLRRLAACLAAGEQPRPDDWKGVAVETMGRVELGMRVTALSAALRRRGGQQWTERQQLAAAKEEAMALEAEVKALSDGAGLPDFLQLLLRATRDGKLEDCSVLAGLFKGIASRLVAPPHGRRYNDVDQDFYATLLNYGGPVLFKFVSENMFGPHIRTVQRDRSRNAFRIELGMGALDERESFTGGGAPMGVRCAAVAPLCLRPPGIAVGEPHARLQGSPT